MYAKCPTYCKDLIKGGLLGIATASEESVASALRILPSLQQQIQLQLIGGSPTGSRKLFSTRRGYISSLHAVPIQGCTVIKMDAVGLQGLWTFVPSTCHFNPWSLSLKPAAVSTYDFFCRRTFFFLKVAVVTAVKLPFQQVWQVCLTSSWARHKIPNQLSPSEGNVRAPWSSGQEDTVSLGLLTASLAF